VDLDPTGPHQESWWLAEVDDLVLRLQRSGAARAGDALPLGEEYSEKGPHRLSAALSHSSCGQLSQRSDSGVQPMPKQNQTPSGARQEPGPGLSTADAAFDVLRKDIAQRNEQAHQKARKLRSAREREQLLMRGNRDF
jgi:hypothetical protein